MSPHVGLWGWKRDKEDKSFTRTFPLNVVIAFESWFTYNGRHTLITHHNDDIIAKRQVIYRWVKNDHVASLLGKSHPDLLGFFIRMEPTIPDPDMAEFMVYALSNSELPIFDSSLEWEVSREEMRFELEPVKPTKWTLYFEDDHHPPLIFPSDDLEYQMRGHPYGYTKVALFGESEDLPLSWPTDRLRWYRLQARPSWHSNLFRLLQWETEIGLHGLVRIAKICSSDSLYIAQLSSFRVITDYLGGWSLLPFLKMPASEMGQFYSRLADSHNFSEHSSILEIMQLYAEIKAPILVSSSRQQISIYEANEALPHCLRMEFKTCSRLPLWVSLLFIHCNSDYSELIDLTRFTLGDARSEISWEMRQLPKGPALARLLQQIRMMEQWMGLEKVASIQIVSSEEQRIAKLKEAPLKRIEPLLTCDLMQPPNNSQITKLTLDLQRVRRQIPRFHDAMSFLRERREWNLLDQIRFEWLLGLAQSPPPVVDYKPKQALKIFVGSSPNSIFARFHVRDLQQFYSDRLPLIGHSSQRLLNNPSPLYRNLYALYYYLQRYPWLRREDHVVLVCGEEIGKQLRFLQTEEEPMASWLRYIRASQASIIYHGNPNFPHHPEY